MQGHLAYAVIAMLLGGAAFAAEPAAEQVLPLEKARDAYTPAAVFGKDSFLVVWQSGLLAPGELRKGPKYSGDIVGCRVDRSGKALDAEAFVISGATDAQEMPRVAWDGKNFLVVWQDYRSGKQYDTYGARVSPQGKVLDAGGVLLDACSHSPEVASAGNGRSLVVVVTLKGCLGPKPQELPFGVIVADGKVEKPLGITYVRGGFRMLRAK